MLEVIAVLVILGVLAAVAVNRFSDIGAREVSVANTLKVHLRYAQLRAMGDIELWGLQITSDSYTLLREEDDVSPPNLPGEESPTKENLEVSLSPETTIYFSPALGQPMDGSKDLLENNQDIQVGDNQTITIYQETGFIP